jgi:hypothetical protein
LTDILSNKKSEEKYTPRSFVISMFYVVLSVDLVKLSRNVFHITPFFHVT